MVITDSPSSAPVLVLTARLANGVGTKVFKRMAVWLPVLPPPVVTARSIMPSWLKSPAVSWVAFPPTLMTESLTKVPA